VKLSKLDINFYKVVIGVGFSLLWARVMYLVWQQPSFTNFVWFYLLVGSVILKWVIFEIVDRIHLKIRIKTVSGELDAASTRVHQATKGEFKSKGHQANITNVADFGFTQRLN